MKKEYALEAVAFELPLPGDQAGQKRRKNGERRERKVEVTSSRKVVAPGPECKQIKRDGRKKQSLRRSTDLGFLRHSERSLRSEESLFVRD